MAACASSGPRSAAAIDNRDIFQGVELIAS